MLSGEEAARLQEYCWKRRRAVGDGGQHPPGGWAVGGHRLPCARAGRGGYRLSRKSMSRRWGYHRSPFLMYCPLCVWRPSRRMQVLSDVVPPYFNRTYGHYCGHKNTPMTGAKCAARLRRCSFGGGMSYAAHPFRAPFKRFRLWNIIAGISRNFAR